MADLKESYSAQVPVETGGDGFARGPIHQDTNQYGSSERVLHREACDWDQNTCPQGPSYEGLTVHPGNTQKGYQKLSNTACLREPPLEDESANHENKGEDNLHVAVDAEIPNSYLDVTYGHESVMNLNYQDQTPLNCNLLKETDETNLNVPQSIIKPNSVSGLTPLEDIIINCRSYNNYDFKTLLSALTLFTEDILVKSQIGASDLMQYALEQHPELVALIIHNCPHVVREFEVLKGTSVLGKIIPQLSLEDVSPLATCAAIIQAGGVKTPLYEKKTKEILRTITDKYSTYNSIYKDAKFLLDECSDEIHCEPPKLFTISVINVRHYLGVNLKGDFQNSLHIPKVMIPYIKQPEFN